MFYSVYPQEAWTEMLDRRHDNDPCRLTVFKVAATDVCRQRLRRCPSFQY
jgi:hypothetical protein